jgi:hypothetical protein
VTDSERIAALGALAFELLDKYLDAQADVYGEVCGPGDHEEALAELHEEENEFRRKIQALMAGSTNDQSV